jgi:L-ascorbate metabolism protein UlaG (beta-lactamase superfamily)
MKAAVLLAFAGALTAASFTTQTNAGALRATFVGNEAFAITDGLTTIVTDFPYESGYSGYMTYRWDDVRTTGEVTCLITHAHRDHFDRTLVPKLGCRVAGPADVMEQVPAINRVATSAPLKVGSARVTPFVTPHIANRPTGHFSYLVEWAGKRLFFVGDTEDPTAVAAQKNLDVAFVTPWLYRNAVRRGLSIDARRIVFYHHQRDETLPVCDRCTVVKQNAAVQWPN